MLCDFYGKVGIKDSIAAVEMTGIYHRSVQDALRKAGFDTRTVHLFASKHYRKPLHPDAEAKHEQSPARFHDGRQSIDLSLTVGIVKNVE